MWSSGRTWSERGGGGIRGKLIIRIWMGIKKILNTLSPDSRIPQVNRRDLPEFSFLDGFKEGAGDEAGNGIDEASRNFRMLKPGILPDNVRCSNHSIATVVPLRRYFALYRKSATA
ncbi:hypothetical protein HAX54_034334 [Datura stramonium]|uniref:Uncharacterized protein n=1 Tax=Datura stramonium TaxID=4076 RepID=A0ABS8SE50_DATST|nr:hypothetical protein [Datura stramonium]